MKDGGDGGTDWIMRGTFFYLEDIGNLRAAVKYWTGRAERERERVLTDPPDPIPRVNVNVCVCEHAPRNAATALNTFLSPWKLCQHMDEGGQKECI